MKRVTHWLQLSALVLGLSLLGAAAAEDGPILLTREHVDLRVVYAPGTTNELFLVARRSDLSTNHASTHVVLVVRRSAETVLPPGFEEFGEPDAPFWILPASQDPELLYLGVSAEGLPRNIFDEPPRVRLVGVQGPGWFFAWQFESGGTLDLKLNTRDGIGPADVIQPVVGSHGHYNWGFSSNGVYDVTFRVEGRRLGATTNLMAADTTFRFRVEPVPPVPAALSRVTAFNGQLTCDLAGTAGVLYRLQTSQDLVRWTDDSVVTGAEDAVSISVALPERAGALYLRALAP